MRFNLPGSRKLLESLRFLFYPTARKHREGRVDQPHRFQGEGAGAAGAGAGGAGAGGAGAGGHTGIHRRISFSSVLYQDEVKEEDERNLNSEIRTAVMMHLYEFLLKNFLNYRVESANQEEDFRTVDYVKSFPEKDRPFLEQFTASSIFDHFLQTHRSRETTNEFDTFSDMVFPSEMKTQVQTHTVPFETAGSFDPSILPKPESLMKVPDTYNRSLFRLDYFEALRVRTLFVWSWCFCLLTPPPPPHLSLHTSAR